MWKNIVRAIDGKMIDNCRDIRNAGGKLNGSLKVGGSWFPAIDGQLLAQIDEWEIVGCSEIVNAGWVLSGVVQILDQNGTKRTRKSILGKFVD